MTEQTATQGLEYNSRQASPDADVESGSEASVVEANHWTVNLAEIMDRRRRQVGFRLAMMGLMVVFFSRYLSAPAMIVWSGVYIALQVWELFGVRRFGFNPTQSRAHRIVCLATICLNSVVFGLPAVLWPTFGGVLGLVCGAYLLSGSILNTVLTTRACRPAFIASVTPFVCYVIGGALLAAGPKMQLGALVTVSIAGAMMSVSAVTLWTNASKTQHSEMAALAALSEREAQLALALQRAEEASQAKSAFLANMSHELRTPLNGVVGMASVLARSDLSASQSEIVQVINDSANSLQTLLSDVLDLAKIEAGQIDLQDDVVTPAALARHVVALFGAPATEKNLSFNLDVDAESNLPVLTDRVRLAQVLTNLCSNAVKFTERGGVTMKVRTRTLDETRRVVFAVTDTGIGLSEIAQTRIFERFAQADGSITRRFGGTGLGLAISKHLTALLGGTIAVESVEGSGATFTAAYDLPVAREEPVAEPGASHAVRIAAASTAPAPRVLLVEDHPVNRQVVQLMLAGVADVDIAVNGAEGVDAARAGGYDLILMDMQMPVMDGVTATRAIRTRETATGGARTPIIMLTANALSEHAHLSADAGADAHLAKPVTAEALFAAMEALLEPAEAGAAPIVRVG